MNEIQKSIIEKYYNKGYRSPNKLFDKLKQKGYNFRKSDVLEYIDSRHILSRVKKYNRLFMGNKYSAIIGTWQIDTYFSDKNKYLIAINVNTRYVWCRKRKSMTSEDFIENMKIFIAEHHPRVIECDDENSFTSFKSVEFIKSNHIIMKIYPGDMDHAQLSIINKFCRTLRVESRYNSDIENIIKIYNKSYHSSLKMEPRDMQYNINNEYRYIYNQLEKRDDKHKLLLQDPIDKGDKVRYIRDEDRRNERFKKDAMRYELSKYYYKVEDKHSDYSYTIIAEDGSVKTVPRYRLYKLTPTEERVMQFAPKIEDENNFQIFDEILDYNPVFKKDGTLDTNKTKYTVRIISRNKNGEKIKNNYYYTIHQLRFEVPTQPAKLELEYYMKHRDKYYIDKNTGYLMPK